MQDGECEEGGIEGEEEAGSSGIKRDGRHSKGLLCSEHRPHVNTASSDLVWVVMQ